MTPTDPPPTAPAPTGQYPPNPPSTPIPTGLSGNSRRATSRPKAASTQMVRADVTQLARAAGLHHIHGVEHATVEHVWAPGDPRRRDEDNLYPLLKVGCDALARG